MPGYAVRCMKRYVPGTAVTVLGVVPCTPSGASTKTDNRARHRPDRRLLTSMMGGACRVGRVSVTPPGDSFLKNSRRLLLLLTVPVEVSLHAACTSSYTN